MNRLVSSLLEGREEKGLGPSTFAWSTPHTNAFVCVVNQRMGTLFCVPSLLLFTPTQETRENRKTGKIRVVPKEGALVFLIEANALCDNVFLITKKTKTDGEKLKKVQQGPRRTCSLFFVQGFLPLLFFSSPILCAVRSLSPNLCSL